MEIAIPLFSAVDTSSLHRTNPNHSDPTFDVPGSKTAISSNMSALASGQPGSVVMTGATGAMGSIFVGKYQTSHPKQHLILLVRDPSTVSNKGLPLASDTISYVACDQTSLDSVRQATKDIISKVQSGSAPRIEVMLQSAAVQVTTPDQPRITVDGYEETESVNYLSHYILLMDLLPYMRPDGRIVIVGSDGHMPDYKFHKRNALYDRIENLVKVEKGSEPASQALTNGMWRYATSKLLQMMTGHEVSERFAIL